MELGYRYWRQYHYGHFATEFELEPYLGLKPRAPWLQRIRHAQFRSVDYVANRLKISKQAYWRLESRESNLKLGTLSKCADVLGCDLVYAVIPRRSMSREIWESLYEVVQLQDYAKAQFPHVRLARMAADQMYNPEFRKIMGWAKNNTPDAHPAVRHYKMFKDIDRKYGITSDAATVRGRTNPDTPV